MNKFLKQLFKPKFKAKLLHDKYKVEEVFKIGGVTYYKFSDEFAVPTGRQLAALAIYEEMNMRCTAEYLEKHTRAMEKILSQKQINLTYVVQLNTNLKERLELMPLPDFIYKLASVVYFDETESIFSYDYEYGKKKIEKWKAAGGTLDFFLKTPLKDLIPSLATSTADLKSYFQVASLIDEIHHRHLTDILSEKV